MSQLRHQQSKLDQLGIQPKLVTFDNDFMAKNYLQSTQLQWPMLIDGDQQLYAAYGMGRGSFWDLYNPVSIAKYIGLILGGQKPGKPGSDWHQLGGDVLIDPEKIVRLHHVSSNPHDRPSIASIFRMVEDTG